MDSSKKEWPQQNGRVEFHLNGGITEISLWMGGRFYIDLRTSEIPVELRQIGTCLSLRMDSEKWLTVEGPGEPDPSFEQRLNKQKDL